MIPIPGRVALPKNVRIVPLRKLGKAERAVIVLPFVSVGSIPAERQLSASEIRDLVPESPVGHAESMPPQRAERLDLCANRDSNAPCCSKRQRIQSLFRVARWRKLGATARPQSHKAHFLRSIRSRMCLGPMRLACMPRRCWRGEFRLAVQRTCSYWQSVHQHDCSTNRLKPAQ